MKYYPDRDAAEIVGADPGTTRLVRSYERESGKPKITSSTPTPGITSFSPLGALREYDYVVAIDTNERMIDNKRCGACVSYVVPNSLSAYGKEVPFVPATAYFISELSEHAKSEPIGWHLTISNHLAPSQRVYSGKVAIVTDSELGIHQKINRQEVGYYKNHLLPEWATLAYASDADADTLQSQMLRYCDRLSRKILDFMTTTTLPLDSLTKGDENYGGSIQVDFLREPMQS